MQRWQGIILVLIVGMSGAASYTPAHAAALYGPPAARHGCAVLLPRSSFPTGITSWTSQQTAPNAGASASGLQLAHYRWGYVIVTPDVLPSLRAARRRYTMESELLHGDRRVHMRAIGQARVAWVTHDGVVGDTVTTILLRAGRTVAMINVGASRAALAPATRLARAVAAHACR